MKQDNTKKKFRVSFKDAHPDKAKYWDFTKNKLNPDQVSKVDEREFWFICEANHPFSLLPKSINRYESWCTTCKNLDKPLEFTTSFQAAEPVKAAYWDFDKNTCSPHEVGMWDQTNRYFICSKGHRWYRKPRSISAKPTKDEGTWCKKCNIYKNSLAVKMPELAKQWHIKNKRTAEEVKHKSNKDVWWQCPKGEDHEWEASPSQRHHSPGCSVCRGLTVVFSNSLAGTFPELLNEIDFDKTDVDPKKLYYQTTAELPWKCIRCSHEWTVPVRSRTYTKTGCEKCSSQTSMPELRIFTELQSLFPDAERRSKLDGKEADIYIPSLKTVIEYDGNYYHKNLDAKDKEKTKIFEALGLTLIRVREEPLACSKLDVQVPKRLAKLEPSHVRQVLDNIEIDNPSISDIAKGYADKNEFVADEEYRRLISYLPAPPPEESLAEKKPELAKEWNYEKNHPLTPEMFYPRSGSRVWWICHKGHEYDATIDKRSGGKITKSRGCPYCRGLRIGYGNSLADSYPEVAKWWFQPLNEGVTPSDVVFGSGERHWFTCENNHVRKRSVKDLTTGGAKCGHCPGRGRGRKYTRPKELDEIKGY
jgi:hypothetical protein